MLGRESFSHIKIPYLAIWRTFLKNSRSLSFAIVIFHLDETLLVSD